MAYIAHLSLLPCMFIDLRAASITSAAVIGLDLLKVEVKWSHERVNNAPLPTRFEVVAKNSSTTESKRVDDPRIDCAALKLKHDTTYSLKVITIYNASTQLESEEVEFKTPSEDEGLSHDTGLDNVLCCVAVVFLGLDYLCSMKLKVMYAVYPTEEAHVCHCLYIEEFDTFTFSHVGIYIVQQYIFCYRETNNWRD